MPDGEFQICHLPFTQKKSNSAKEYDKFNLIIFQDGGEESGKKTRLLPVFIKRPCAVF